MQRFHCMTRHKATAATPASWCFLPFHGLAASQRATVVSPQIECLHPRNQLTNSIESTSSRTILPQVCAQGGKSCEKIRTLLLNKKKPGTSEDGPGERKSVELSLIQVGTKAVGAFLTVVLATKVEELDGAEQLRHVDIPVLIDGIQRVGRTLEAAAQGGEGIFRGLFAVVATGIVQLHHAQHLFQRNLAEGRGEVVFAHR